MKKSVMAEIALSRCCSPFGVACGFLLLTGGLLISDPPAVRPLASPAENGRAAPQVEKKPAGGKPAGRPAARAQQSPSAPATPPVLLPAEEIKEEEEVLHAAGCSPESISLLEFLRRRARVQVPWEELQTLTRKLGGDPAEAAQAQAQLVGFGPAAVTAVRQAANDLHDLSAARRARACLRWLTGSDSVRLVTAAIRLLTQRQPAGACEVLLAYAPLAETPELLQEVRQALATLAYATQRPDPTLVQALTSGPALARALAADALCQAAHAELFPQLRKLLHDADTGVRWRVALALLRENQLDGVPLLIELLGDLPAEERRQTEETLQELAGDWAPKLPEDKNDDITRRLRRDAWQAWWKNTAGPALLAEFQRRTPTAAQQERLQQLIAQLKSDSFVEREQAMQELRRFGALAVPLLQQVVQQVADPEQRRRARLLLEELRQGEHQDLPLAAPRLLALRQPAEAAAALLAYLPWCAQEELQEEILKALTQLVRQAGSPPPALLQALQAENLRQRQAAALALAQSHRPDLWPRLRPLLQEPDPSFRARLGLALLKAGDRQTLPLLLQMLPELPGESLSLVLEVLTQLAGDQAPTAPVTEDAAGRRQLRDAWLAWWKSHQQEVDLRRLQAPTTLLGYTLLVEADGCVREINAQGQTRWEITGLLYPVDAHFLGPDRLLIVEYNGRRVSERDRKGKIYWEYTVANGLPVNAQRLPNGNTFIATSAEILEVTRQGKEVFRRALPSGLIAAAKSSGGLIVCLLQNGTCLLLDHHGKELSSFASGRGPSWTSGIDLEPGGRILIANPSMGQVVEFDRRGREVLRLPAAGITTATWLPNGHILTASYTQRQVVELDRQGRVLWRYQSERHVFRARRR
jgi:HEAT repeat protein